MPATFSPLPEDEPMLTLPEFLRRLEREPAFVQKMRAHYEAALAVPPSPETEAMREAAAKALQALKHHQGVFLAKQKLTELVVAMDDEEDSPGGGSHGDPKRLMDEAVDHLLDVCEPERTALMKKVTEIQTALREVLDKK